jgi:hypothetical protein
VAAVFVAAVEAVFVAAVAAVFELVINFSPGRVPIVPAAFARRVAFQSLINSDQMMTSRDSPVL